MKWRNSKERELLASGGSREQTLPTKNNPNPDLSDVKDELMGTGKPNSNELFLEPKDDFSSTSSTMVGSLDLLQQSHEVKMDLLAQQANGGGHVRSKLKIKDASSLNYSEAVQRFGPFGYHDPNNESEFTDEDINVTDEMNGSNNEDSDDD